MLQCARCIVAHGAPGCPATLEDLEGKPSCAWCEDGEPCPVLQKQQRASRKKTPEETPPAASDVNSEKPASEQESGVTTMKTPETDANIAPKCKRPGCTIELSPRNHVGLCRAHVRWTAPGERAASSDAPTNGYAHAHARGNGVGNGANGVHKTGNGVGNGGNGRARKAEHEASTPANGSNGAVAVLPTLAADRVDHLIANLPAADKEKLAFAWLRGEL
jgi:hypothetical protein